MGDMSFRVEGCKKYQLSRTLATRQPPVMPRCLQFQNGCQGPEIGVPIGFLGAPLNFHFEQSIHEKTGQKKCGG